MTTIELVANDQLLQVTVSPKISSGEVNTVSIHVDFSDEWNNFGKNAVFYTSYNSRDIYEIVMTNDECIVPSEVMKKSGALYIGIRGVNNNEVKTTSLVKLKISEGAPTGNSTEVEPTPDVYQQLLTAYGKTDNSIKKEKAERQAEIAVERARIDNLSTLTEGSTTGDAELTDLRVGADGKTYPNAGAAVRGQIGDIGRELRDFEKVVVSDIRVQRKHQVGMYIAPEIKETYTDYAVNSIAYPPGKYKVLRLASDTVGYSYHAEDIQGNSITGNTFLNKDTTFESDFDFFITLRKSKYPTVEGSGVTDSDLAFIDNNLVVTRIINENGNTLEDRVKKLEGSAVSLDDTLTDPAKAAPADVVGKLKGDLSALQNGGYVADQQQIGQKVSDWLDEHPEATTTVQNGVITESKIHHDFLPYIKNNYVTPKMFGAKGDGITDDTKAINSCLKYCEENGLDCFFDRAIYKISHTGGTGGEAYSIELQPHVSIDFNNSTVISNTYDIFFRSKALNILAKAKIVNDTHEGDNKITVDEGSKFKIGDYVFIRYGENGTDTPEPEDVLYAHIVEINGNEITIDKVLPFDVSVDSITREHNNIVILISYDEVCRNITYKNLYAIGNEQTESIFYLLNCSGIRFENIHGEQTGAGLIAGQFCSNVFVNDLYITRSYGYTQISKGRGFGFSSSHNIVVDKAYIESCQRAYVIAESNTQIRFNELHIRRNGISRDLTQNYFGIFYKSSIHVKNLYIDDDCKDTNFDNYYKLTCENLFTYDKKPIKCFASPNLYLMYNDLNFNDVYTHLEVVEITEQNNTIYLPKGKIKDFTLRLNSDDTPTWLSFGRFKDDGSLNGDNLKEYFVNNGNIHPFTSRHPIFIDIYSSYLLNYTDLYPIVLVSFGKIPTNAKLSIYVRYFNN